MALTDQQKLARVQKGKALVTLYYNNAGIKNPYSDVEKVLTAADSFAKEPFYQRLGGQIELAIDGGTSQERINSAVLAMAKQNYGVMPTTRDITAFGNILVDLSTSTRTKFSLLVTQVGQGLSEAAGTIMNIGKATMIAYVAAGALGLFFFIKSMSPPRFKNPRRRK